MGTFKNISDDVAQYADKVRAWFGDEADTWDALNTLAEIALGKYSAEQFKKDVDAYNEEEEC